MRRFLAITAVLLGCAFSAAAQMVLCESLGGYRECHVGALGTIRLVSELSENRCVEGASWGTHSPGVVWVDRLCRAFFAIRSEEGTRVVCESQNGKRAVCAADTSNGVAVRRQLSTTFCDKGDTWGYEQQPDQIWVERGCRAEFTLGPRPGPAPPAPRLDTPVVCESLDGHRTECPANTAAGVQLARQLSESRCGFGTEWGYDQKIIWVSRGCRAEFAASGKPKPAVRTVTCESKDDPRIHCAAETRYGVALVRQLGEKACVLGNTWDFDGDGVWVSGGCRARFALGGFRLQPEAVPPTASRTVCESLDGNRVQCAVDASRGAGLVRQLGERDCVLNHTWGYDRDGIWVSEGCRAEFAVAHQ